jgi:hypothetical protein
LATNYNAFSCPQKSIVYLSLLGAPLKDFMAETRLRKKLIGNPFFNEVHSFNVFAWEGNIWLPPQSKYPVLRQRAFGGTGFMFFGAFGGTGFLFLGRLGSRASTEKNWANYEQILRVFFHVTGAKRFLL